MALDLFIRQGQQSLRCGYTTGSCATLAAKSSAKTLLSGQTVTHCEIVTPSGVLLDIPVNCLQFDGTTAEYSLLKDGGDDYDVTHGAEIRVKVTLLPPGEFQLFGGIGVGVITKPGLDQPVGTSAINRVPREMIWKELELLSEEYGYSGGFSVEISVPRGEELAKKTFNPQLGIVGGISILGTTGIVEPKSSAALVDTIDTELNMYRVQGNKEIILTPGYYGTAFLQEYPQLYQRPVVQISNFVGDSIDLMAVHGFSQGLFVGHVGKFVKIAAGIMNTHSHFADGRMEIFTAYAGLCGGSTSLLQQLMEAVTTESCLDLLAEAGLEEAVVSRILSAIQGHIARRAGDVQVGVVLFRNGNRLLGSSPEGKKILKDWAILQN